MIYNKEELYNFYNELLEREKELNSRPKTEITEGRISELQLMIVRVEIENISTTSVIFGEFNVHFF